MGVINVPKTKHVIDVYGFEFGTNPIGSDAAPTDGKLFMLQGDGNADIGPPFPLCLPSTVAEEESAATMTMAQFSTQLQQAEIR